MINRGAAAYWIPAFAGMTPNVTRVRPTSSHCGRGRIASSDAIRVRGCGVSMDLDPHPNPLPQGERELTAAADKSTSHPERSLLRNGEATFARRGVDWVSRVMEWSS